MELFYEIFDQRIINNLSTNYYNNQCQKFRESINISIIAAKVSLKMMAKVAESSIWDPIKKYILIVTGPSMMSITANNSVLQDIKVI